MAGRRDSVRVHLAKTYAEARTMGARQRDGRLFMPGGELVLSARARPDSADGLRVESYVVTDTARATLRAHEWIAMLDRLVEKAAGPNPVAIVRETSYQGKPAYRSVYTFCPGCQNAHPFRVEVFDGCPPRDSDGEPYPTWEWDGNLESPTFAPSMLAQGSVHICEGEHPPAPCTGDCDQTGHLLADDGTRLHNTPHTRDPAWGSCHSFLRAGRWEFLSDSAHALAGQTVDMVPLPDWLCW